MTDVEQFESTKAIPQPWKSNITVEFAGLVAFTVLVVTSRWPGADVAIAIALAGLALRLRKVQFPAPFCWGMGLLIWAYMTSFFAMSPSIAAATALDRLKVMLIFLVVMNAIRTPKQLRWYLVIFLLSFLAYPVRGALLNEIHGDLLFNRTAWFGTGHGLYANPNDLATVALLVLGAAISIASHRGSRAVRWGAITSVPILLLVILLTESRAGFLGLTVGFGVPFILRVARRRMLLAYAATAIIIGLNVLPHSLWVRLSGMTDLMNTATISNADPEGSAAMRWEVQRTGWKIFADHPIMGVGLGCYQMANSLYDRKLGDRDTHNTYLNLADELGLPGLMMWVGLVSSVLLRARRMRLKELSREKANPMGWLECGIYAFLIAALFGTYSGITPIYLALGALWSGVSISDRRSLVLPGRKRGDMDVIPRTGVSLSPQ